MNVVRPFCGKRFKAWFCTCLGLYKSYRLKVFEYFISWNKVVLCLFPLTVWVKSTFRNYYFVRGFIVILSMTFQSKWLNNRASSVDAAFTLNEREFVLGSFPLLTNASSVDAGPKVHLHWAKENTWIQYLMSPEPIWKRYRFRFHFHKLTI